MEKTNEKENAPNVIRFKFTPRIEKAKIRRIYEDDARGLHDELLIDDVGFTLYMRCLDIIAVNDARNGKVRCQKCWEREGEEIYIEYEKLSFKEMKELSLKCEKCGCEFMWEDYVKSYRKQQLNSGGAMPAFQKYVKEYPVKKTAHEKMMLIDYLIHEFHYSLRSQPDLPTRSVGANLIQGRLTDIMEFLDELTYNTSPITSPKASEWKAKLRR